jgi:hypothetical protein
MKRPGLKRKPSRTAEGLRKATLAPAKPAARRSAKIVSLLEPDIVLARASRRFLPGPVDRCVKCDSTFVGREPAFIHCYYCGKMARIANASLLVQEEFERRAGLRIAS